MDKESLSLFESIKEHDINQLDEEQGQNTSRLISKQDHLVECFVDLLNANQHSNYYFTISVIKSALQEDEISAKKSQDVYQTTLVFYPLIKVHNCCIRTLNVYQSYLKLHTTSQKNHLVEFGGEDKESSLNVQSILSGKKYAFMNDKIQKREYPIRLDILNLGEGTRSLRLVNGKYG